MGTRGTGPVFLLFHGVHMVQSSTLLFVVKIFANNKMRIDLVVTRKHSKLIFFKKTNKAHTLCQFLSFSVLKTSSLVRRRGYLKEALT